MSSEQGQSGADDGSGGGDTKSKSGKNEGNVKTELCMDPARVFSGDVFRKIFFSLSARDICHASLVSYVVFSCFFLGENMCCVVYVFILFGDTVQKIVEEDA